MANPIFDFFIKILLWLNRVWVWIRTRGKFPYKLGRKPPSNKPALKFSQFWTGVIPDHPVSVDYLSKLKNWLMLGNDRYGDCVAVMISNNLRKVTFYAGKEFYGNLDWVLQLYKTQNPGFPAQDDGMDIQTLLEYLLKTGTPDGRKLIAFAKVDDNNLELCKAATAIFGGLCIGFIVQQANLDQFSQGKPWEYVPGSPIVGGHGVEEGGYLGNLANDMQIVTWAEQTGFTDKMWAHNVEEAWILIWREHLTTAQFQEGVDLEKLKQAYKDITGRDLIIPPEPPPEPPPNPNPGCLSLIASGFRDIAGNTSLNEKQRLARALRVAATDLEKKR